MKKIFISLLLFAAVVTVFAQSVPRQMVVLEVGTGTWCTYCPGAAMGADDLLENGKQVAVVENHNGDGYANSFSNARNSFYGISGYPTATFDGFLAVVGGSHSSSMYPNYLPKYNQAMAVLSPIHMSMDVTNDGLNYTATITVTKVDNITATSLKLHFAVTQSHINQMWQGQTHLEHVNRLMVPNQNGTDISFASGNVQTVVLNFTMQAAWPIEDCEFVAWVQNYDAGQGTIAGSGSPAVKKWVTLQGIKRGAIDLTPEFSVANPYINKGESVTFSNETNGGYIGTPETYEWIFAGGTPATSTEENPVVSFNECGGHDITLIVNRGGQIDTLTKTAYIQVGPEVNVTANPGFTTCWYNDITLDATTPNATSYLWMPGGETTPTKTLTFAQYGIGSFDFTVTVNAGGCETVKNVTATLDACTGINDKEAGVAMTVFPNPTSGDFTLSITAPRSFTADLTMVNSLGMTVYTEKNLSISGTFVRNMNLEGLAAGIYMLSLRNNDMQIVRKVVVR